MQRAACRTQPLDVRGLVSRVCCWLPGLALPVLLSTPLEQSRRRHLVSSHAVLRCAWHCFCLQVYEVMLDGVLPLAAKVIDIGADPKLRTAFVRVGKQGVPCTPWLLLSAAQHPTGGALG
jgi:hypothetical protein